jgi:serine/threonine protein kinase/tetratricopeptide (TPR) repeat protein
MVGQTYGHYRIIDKIGAGGMGEVYRAHDEQLDRDVALKLLPAGTVSDEGARKQFRKEALALAKLNHPNIETIYEFNSQDGVDFLVMELVPGQSLDEMLYAGPMPELEVVRLGTQFADGLAAAHEQGIIHRDLKPANIFVTPDGRVKILDFGLAKLMHPGKAHDVTHSVTMQSGAISGTVPYMSPEQLRGLPVDVRSDIYAAGAVLYEMATGRRPFPQTQTAELMTAILVQTLPPARSVNPVVSPKMENVIAKSLEKDPTQRFQSARDLRAALQGVAALSSTVSFQPDPQLMASSESAVPVSAAAKSSSSWIAVVGVAALACLIVAGLLFGLNVHGMRDRVLKRHRPVAEPPATPSLAIENPPAKPAPAQPAAAPQPAPSVTVPPPSPPSPAALTPAPASAQPAAAKPAPSSHPDNKTPAPSVTPPRNPAGPSPSARKSDELHKEGLLLAENGDVRNARAKFEQALAIDREAGDRTRAANQLNAIASALVLEGNLDSARKESEEALSVSREAGDNALAASALANLGDALLGVGDLSGAKTAYEKSLAMTRVLGDAPAQGPDLLGLAQIRYTQGDLASAKRMLDEAEPAVRKSSDKTLSAVALRYKGNIMLAQDDLDGARKSYEQALNLFNSMGAKRQAAETQIALAKATIEEGIPGETRAPLHEAILEFRAEQDNAGEVLAHAALARALLDMGGPQFFVEAQKQVNISVPLAVNVQDPRPRFEMRIVAARVAAGFGETPKARGALETEISDLEKRGFVPLQFDARLALGEMLMNVGKSGNGRFLLRALEKDATDKGFLLIARKARAASLATPAAK